jgi:hypothetical protein
LVFCGVFVFVLLFSILMLPFWGGWFARVDVCRYMCCDLLCSAIKLFLDFLSNPSQKESWWFGHIVIRFSLVMTSVGGLVYPFK